MFATFARFFSVRGVALSTSATGRHMSLSSAKENSEYIPMDANIAKCVNLNATQETLKLHWMILFIWRAAVDSELES